MCRQVRCRKCGKVTWAGCGNHVKEVMRGVSASQRCPGHENDPKEPGFFSKIFSKKK